MTVFAVDLERKCRNLVRQQHWKDEQEHLTPEDLVGHEIALTLDHIDMLRGQDKELRNRLEEQRLRLESSILNYEPLRHHSTQIWFERSRLKNQLRQTLARIEQQFQRLTLENQKVLHSLQKRLLELWNMRGQLFKNGNVSNSA